MFKFKLLLFLLILIPFSSGAVNIIDVGSVPTNLQNLQGINVINLREVFNNNTAFVNSSGNWITPSLGVLSDADATQFNNNAGTLTIDTSWLTSFGDNEWLALDQNNWFNGSNNWNIWDGNSLNFDENKLDPFILELGYNHTENLTIFYDERYLTSQLSLYFYNNSDSTHGAYTIMNTSIPTGDLQVDNYPSMGDGSTLLTKRILTELNITLLQTGAYDQHTNIDFLSGNKDVQLRSEIYILYDNGTEVEIGNSPNSEVLVQGVLQQVVWTGTINTQTTFGNNSHLTMYLYAVVSGVGSPPSINLVVADETASRLDIGIDPIDIRVNEIDPFAFHKDGTTNMTASANFGGFNLTNVNWVNADIFNGSNLIASKSAGLSSFGGIRLSNLVFRPGCDVNTVAYWQMEGNANDSYSIFDGTGFPSTSEGFVVGNAADFVDGTQMIDIIDSDSELSLEGGLGSTIEFWFKAATSASNSSLLNKGNYEIKWMKEGSFPSITFRLEATINGVTITSPPDLSTGTDYHIVLTWKKLTQNLTLYINNVLQDFDTLADFGTSSNNLQMGEDFIGFMDEVALYNVSLTRTEISQHYTKSSFGNNYCKTNSPWNLINEKLTYDGDVEITESLSVDVIDSVSGNGININDDVDLGAKILKFSEGSVDGFSIENFLTLKGNEGVTLFSIDGGDINGASWDGLAFTNDAFNAGDLGTSGQPWITTYTNTVDLGTNTIDDVGWTGNMEIDGDLTVGTVFRVDTSEGAIGINTAPVSSAALILVGKAAVDETSGQGVSLEAGIGGDKTGAGGPPSQAAMGGSFLQSAGLGGTGKGSAGAIIGGAGGRFVNQGGQGGAATSTDSPNTAGKGGALDVIAGTGGAAVTANSEANTAGKGGALNFASGIGGNAANGATNTGGAGGDVSIRAGAGGTGATANGVGGSILLKIGADTVLTIDEDKLTTIDGNLNISDNATIGDTLKVITSPNTNIRTDGIEMIKVSGGLDFNIPILTGLGELVGITTIDEVIGLKNGVYVFPATSGSDAVITILGKTLIGDDNPFFQLSWNDANERGLLTTSSGTNADIDIIPDGTGIVNLVSDVDVTGDLDVVGNITADRGNFDSINVTGNAYIGELTWEGNLDLGGNNLTDVGTGKFNTIGLGGASPTAQTLINMLGQTYTPSSGNWYGLDLGPFIENSGEMGNVNGLNLAAFVNNNANDIGSMSGILAGIGTLGDYEGDIGELNGVKVAPAHVGSGEVEDFSLFLGSQPFGVGPINNMYGLRLGTITRGTNNWAIKTELGLVDFGDDVDIAGNLTVTGNITADRGNFDSINVTGNAYIGELTWEGNLDLGGNNLTNVDYVNTTNLIVNNNTLIVDSTNNNVGIGKEPTSVRILDVLGAKGVDDVGQGIAMISGEGDDVTGFGPPAQGKAGGTIVFTSGKGGQSSGTDAVGYVGGTGGAFQFLSGAGGNSIGSDANNRGGTSGIFQLVGGTAGNAEGATTGDNLGGSSGVFKLNAGNAGNAANADGTNIGGDGGDFQLATGRGGTGTTSDGADGKFELVIGGSFGTTVLTGLADASGIDITGDLNVSENLTVVDTGFFGWLGSLASRITKLWVQDIDVSGDLNVSGNATIGGGIIIGSPTNSQNITMHSPDGTAYSCGVQDGGAFSCV